jgi:phage I-like protein
VPGETAVSCLDEGARRGVRYAIHHLTERQAIVTERELLDVALKHVVGRATLRDVEREVDRQVASGNLIRESSLYRLADQPEPKPPRTRSAWVAVVAAAGFSRKEARQHVDAGIANGRFVEAERRYTTQTALRREKSILQVEREGRDQMTPLPTRPRSGHSGSSVSRPAPGVISNSQGQA